METEDTLHIIATHLTDTSIQSKTCSLHHGKMGILTFLAHFAEYTGNSFYEEASDDLAENIMNHIDQTRTIDFENGLMGIGCGIEYLIQEGLIQKNGNEILEDIDQVLFLVINNEERLQCSQQKVLTGWMKYLMYRLKGQLNYAEDSITIRNKTLFIHCIDLIEYYFEYYISQKEELMFLLYKGLSLNIINYKIHRLLSRLEEEYTSCEKQFFEKRENEWMQKSIVTMPTYSQTCRFYQIR